MISLSRFTDAATSGFTRCAVALLVIVLLATATSTTAWASSGNLTTVAVADATPGTVLPGAAKVPLLSFRVTPTAADTFDALTVRFSGSSTADIATVFLYQEAGSVPGTFSAGSDTPRGSTSSEVGGSFTIDPANFGLSAGIQRQFYVVVDLAADAAVGHTVDIEVETDQIVLASGTWPPASEAAAGTWDPPGAATIDLGLFHGHGDIGAVGAAGSTAYSAATYTINASGANIGGTADEFRYVYRPVTGDARITVRVESQENTHVWAKAGPMFRETLTAGSRHAFVATTPLDIDLILLQSSNGVGFGWRSATDGTTSESSWTGSTAHVAPYWLRLTRVGDTFTAERSGNGSTWTAVGTPQAIAMASTIYVGLANTSRSDGSINTSTFDNVTITTPPVAVADSYSTAEDTPLSIPASGVLDNDSDPEGTALTVGTPRPVGAPASGSLTLNANGSFTYTPGANFNGSDAFTYLANDGVFNSAVATVSITVDARNDAPSFAKGANESVQEGAGGQSVPGWASAISPGPADESAQVVDFLVTNDNAALFSSQPAISPAGTLSYAPAADADGSATVTVRAHDDGGTANGGTDTSTAQTFTISVSDGNDAPVNGVPGPQTVATNGALVFSTATGNGISLADADAGAAAVEVALTSTNGTLTLPVTAGLAFSVGDGTADATMTFSGPIATINSALDGLTFTPATSYAGTATVEIATDDLGNSGPGGPRSDIDSVGITVVDIPPAAVDDAYEAVRDTPLIVGPAGVLANDSDPLLLPLTVAAPRPVSGPFNGSLTLSADGSFSYVPNLGFDGVDTFTYRATNGLLASNEATVTITVNAGYVSSSGWPTAFDADRYLELRFPAYLAPGSTVTGAVLSHTYRSASAGATTCYYFETWRGTTLLAAHGSPASPVSCNGGTDYAADVIDLPEVDSAAEANELILRLYLRNSDGGRSSHRLATLAVTSELDSAP
jgi:hypothetical protein